MRPTLFLAFLAATSCGSRSNAAPARGDATSNETGVPDNSFLIKFERADNTSALTDDENTTYSSGIFFVGDGRRGTPHASYRISTTAGGDSSARVEGEPSAFTSFNFERIRPR